MPIHRPLHISLVVAFGLALSWTGIGAAAAQADATPSSAHLADHVVALPRPAGVPLASDVTFSSHWIHPKDDKDPLDTFTTAAEYHATRLDWMYLDEKRAEIDEAHRQRVGAFMERAKALGLPVAGTLNTTVSDERMALRDRKGVLKLDHLRKMIGDPTVPALGDDAFARSMALLKLGCTSLQRDDPAFGSTRRHRQLHDFYTTLHARIDAAAGHHVIKSCNAYELVNYDDRQAKLTYFADYDWFMAEISAKNEAQAPMYRRAVERAAALGKPLALTLQTDPGRDRIRRMVAWCYALGINPVPPWDVYHHAEHVAGRHTRLYAPASEHADLYGFVRAIPHLLDGYEAVPMDRAADVASTDRKDVLASVRAKAGDRSAPLVVHLVAWEPGADGVIVTIGADRCFAGKPVRLQVLRPVAYDAEAHAKAHREGETLRAGGLQGPGQRAAYAPLMAEVPVKPAAGTEKLTIELAAPDPWQVLVIHPGAD